VKDFACFRILMSEVTEEILTEEMIDGCLSGSHAVPESAPGAPMPVSSKYRGVIPERAREIGAQQRRHGCLRENTGPDLGKNAESGQEAQQTIERGRMCAGQLCKSLDGTYSIGEVICHP
jgi:hypothetical protein